MLGHFKDTSLFLPESNQCKANCILCTCYSTNPGSYSTNPGSYSANPGGYSTNPGSYSTHSCCYSANQVCYSTNPECYSTNPKPIQCIFLTFASIRCERGNNVATRQFGSTRINRGECHAPEVTRVASLQLTLP